MTEILIPGRTAEPSELTKMPLAMEKLLKANGWTYKFGYSRFKEPAEIYKGTDNAGLPKKPERIVDNVWVDAVHYDRKKKVTAVWHDGSFNNALWGDWVAPRLINSLTLAALVRGDIEEPDEYAAWKAAKKEGKNG